jgi:hypothetical protein
LGLPTKCPLPGCDYTSIERDELVISAPFIRSPKTTRTDASYRELETSSAARAELAAQMAGVSVSEMSHLKVTNIRDARHPGDVAAVPVVNDVTRQMDLIRARGGQSGYSGQGQPIDTGTATGAVTINGQVVQGIEPRAGRRAMELQQQLMPSIATKPYSTKFG